MSYEDKFGITEIRTGQIDRLSLSYDYETDPKQRYPVFLYTPDMEDKSHGCPHHAHIHFTPEQAKVMRDWFIAYCDDPERKPLDENPWGT